MSVRGNAILASKKLLFGLESNLFKRLIMNKQSSRYQNQTIRLLHILGSPFVKPSSGLAINDGEAKSLYHLAFRNKVGLFFLDTLKRKGVDLGELQAEHDKGHFRYKETLVTAENISRVLDSAGIDHVIFKFFKPYPFTPSDVDVLLMCPDCQYQEAYKLLFNSGYHRLGAAPHQVIAYDLRGGIDNMDTSLRDGKKGGIYYIDLYDEIAASHVIYVDKTKLREFTIESEKSGCRLKTLKPEAELAVCIAHSVLPEQMYTLADYFTLLFYLKEMSSTEVDNLISMVRRDKLRLACKATVRLTASFHQSAHGFIPEPLKELADKLGVRNIEGNASENLQAPYKFEMLTVVRALSEKLPSAKFTGSAARQAIAMLNPRMGKSVIKDLFFRRKRETY